MNGEFFNSLFTFDIGLKLGLGLLNLIIVQPLFCSRFHNFLLLVGWGPIDFVEQTAYHRGPFYDYCFTVRECQI